jgi:hypothetical protein
MKTWASVASPARIVRTAEQFLEFFVPLSVEKLTWQQTTHTQIHGASSQQHTLHSHCNEAQQATVTHNKQP